MKQFLLTAILGFTCFLLKAQSITISNASGCTVTFYIAATDPTCSSVSGSVTYSLPPGGNVTFPNFAAVTWTGPTPVPGWQWDYIKQWNGCGVMSWTPPACGQNVCAVGIPCSGLPISSCMIVNTMCNTCTAYKTQWYPVGGGNVVVKMW